MFNSIEFVRSVCAQRNIPVSQLERDCGFSNGYLNPKKMKKLPYDRAVTIGQYLDIPAEEILNGPDTQKVPAETGRHKISDEDLKFALWGGRENVSDEMLEEIRGFAAYIAQREDQKKNI